jgi:hypothetical protein
MITEIELGNSGRKMVIKKRENGHLESVEDDQGHPFHTAGPDEISITHRNKNSDDSPGTFTSSVVSVGDGTILVTEHNPTCAWYYYRGTWYWLCF